ncbi:heavy metal translocating P-type ATPase [candidate division KSB1 bacterium]|nr:heavy metal translocating P-type ATPase [candidate division KSB1 bacterium]
MACPCALVISTPVTIVSGLTRAARSGILIKGGNYLEAMAKVDAVVLDKTGTITIGKPEVVEVISLNSLPEDKILSMSASVESASEHPIGRAVVAKARVEKIQLSEVTDFQAITGKGVVGKIAGKNVLVGTRALLNDFNVNTNLSENKITALEAEAKTTMLTAVNGEVVGAVAVADEIKEGAAEAIAKIKKMGYQVAILTGDNRETAAAIAKKLQMTHVLAEVLPHEKVAEIQRLQRELGKVAMIGDGINDAPALTQADVGIAVGTGTDIAIESADITLVRGDLKSVASAIKLSRATFRKIKQNLFWAFFYNVVAIPLAVSGLLHPVIAEIAMASSSVTVVSNANLLKRLRL